jgi:hypothetical protein
VLDEGAYLYKGYLFATGQYVPFQEYGVWTNQMPLSFLIPGYVQLAFGPGIRTGRYLAIFLGFLILVGLWLIAYRLGGRWWAALIILLFTWNPALSQMYSIAVSQVLIAALFTWMLVLSLGDDRSIWQVIASSFLAGVMVMTRLNMAPVPVLLFVFFAWKRGWKIGLLSVLITVITVGIGHVLFWPGILQTWAAWLPRSVTPFLNQWRVPEEYSRLWNPEISLEGRFTSFFRGVRFHFIPMIGVLVAILLWPNKERWNSENRWGDSIFVAISFIILLLIHMWAALGKDYCVFCLEGYLAFFCIAGFVLIILTMPVWRQRITRWRQWVIAILILVATSGIGFSAYEEISRPLYDLPVPRILSGSFKPGFVLFGAILENKFQLTRPQVWHLLPPIAGLLVGLLILGLTFLFYRFIPLRRDTSFGYYCIVFFFIIGIILTPSVILGGGYQRSVCEFDTIQSFQETGQYLAKLISQNSTVYWKGGLSIVPLLYVSGIKIYPPQINDGYSYVEGGDPQTLLKFGLWNKVLGERWSKEADFILIEKRSYDGWLKEYVNSGYFEELPTAPPTVLCREDYAIRIFRRLR